jgi:hypothetical protein
MMISTNVESGVNIEIWKTDVLLAPDSHSSRKVDVKQRQEGAGQRGLFGRLVWVRIYDGVALAFEDIPAIEDVSAWFEVWARRKRSFRLIGVFASTVCALISACGYIAAVGNVVFLHGGRSPVDSRKILSGWMLAGCRTFR